MLLQWWSSAWRYWGRGTRWPSTSVCCWSWVAWLCSSTNPTRARLLQKTTFLALEKCYWWVPHISRSCLDVATTFVSCVGVEPLSLFSCRVVAGLADPGRLDRCGPGPHEDSLPDQCQPHDAQHQHVVHAGSGTWWVKRLLCQTRLSHSGWIWNYY